MAENPKTYDQAFKALSDVDPRGLLGIFGVLPRGVQAVVEPIPRELSMRPLEIDSGYLVRKRGRKPYIVLFEALTSWKRPIAERLAWYGAFLGHKYSMPVHVYVVPLIVESCPRRTPSYGRAVRGGVTVTARLHWVKPWQIDARHVLETKSVELDPWAILFDISRAQEAQAFARVKGNRGGAPLLRMLIGLRYRKDRDERKMVLERMADMIGREIWLESAVVQEWLDEGRVEGRVEGAAVNAKAMLTKFLAFKFPNMEIPASLDSIRDAGILNLLFDKAAVTKDKIAMARAIDKASKGLKF